MTLDEAYGRSKFVSIDIDSKSIIEYNKVKTMTPISINNNALQVSTNRNFEVTNNSFTYELFERFMMDSGILRDYNTNKFYNIKSFLNDYIMIEDTYTDRKRIDLGVSSDYNPIKLISTDLYTINVDASIYRKVSAFIKVYDNATLNSLCSFICSEKKN